MARSQITYVCGRCGSVSLKWQGQCAGCGEWNTLEPSARVDVAGSRPARGAGSVLRLADVKAGVAGRWPTGLGELDRVLGGGLVAGSVVLVGGPPGIGKSTLLLQVAGTGTGERATLYASGEESAEQVALRAQRLGLPADRITMLATTDVDEVIEAARSMPCTCLVVDSIQTMSSGGVPSAPGSPNQLRECAARLVQLAKSSGMAVVLVGHVTKEGVIAGPRLLEHMVDVVLYFEDEAGSRYRLLRSVKNRFGAANELGIFAMGETGLREVRNPSAIFLSRPVADTPGSVVTVLHQGTRPLLVEVQALTDRGGDGPSRRLAIGVDPNRLAMLLAVLHRHAGQAVHEEDVFVNVVGGVRVAETAADLALLLAVVSSRLSKAILPQTVVFGEVGLGGEIRPVAYGEERLREAAKLGFGHAIVPQANVPRRPITGIEVVGVSGVAEALRCDPRLGNA
ncbi:MAG: DNA repair protein RadA [Gammaproteobacteria bacterium]|nr:DNA repair protein RadA [Gammaproteobacteria bacterium]